MYIYIYVYIYITLVDPEIWGMERPQWHKMDQ